MPISFLFVLVLGLRVYLFEEIANKIRVTYSPPSSNEFSIT